MAEKYLKEVSAAKIVERIKGLLSRGVSTPLRKEWVIRGFGGTQWNLRETSAIDFDAGFDYLSRCRAINIINEETFEITDYFETFAPRYPAPPPLPIQISKQIENEAEVMRHCYHWLFVFENTLRTFIQDSLSEKYGKDWCDKLSKKVKADIEKNKKNWCGGIPPRSPLEFTELPSLGNIIMSKWQDVFKDKFVNINPTSLEESLKKIEGFRNAIAHCRMLTEEQSRMFYYEVKRVLSSLKS